MDDAFRKGKSEDHGDFSFLTQGVAGEKKGQCASVEDMHQEAVDMTRKVLESTAADGQDFIPVAFIYSPLDETHVTVAMLADGFENKESKQKLGRALASFARQHKSAAIVLGTDGWAVKHDDVPEAYRIRPSEHPDRVEVLSVNCIYPDGTCVGVLMEYKRHDSADGKGQTIEWQEVQDGRTVKGEMRTEQNIIPAWSEGAVV